MRIAEFKGTNLELTEAIKGYAQQKLESLEKFCERYSPCNLMVEVGKTTQHHKNGDVYFAEFRLEIPGTQLIAKNVMDDLYAAIDKAKDDLKRQLIDHKERLTAVRP